MSGWVNVRLGNLRAGLDDLEAVAHRHPEDDDGVGGDEENPDEDDHDDDEQGP